MNKKKSKTLQMKGPWDGQITKMHIYTLDYGRTLRPCIAIYMYMQTQPSLPHNNSTKWLLAVYIC